MQHSTTRNAARLRSEPPPPPSALPKQEPVFRAPTLPKPDALVGWLQKIGDGFLYGLGFWSSGIALVLMVLAFFMVLTMLGVAGCANVMNQYEPTPYPY